ncbi:Fic family protein [Limnobacter sp.]|uniref:Fic family protein n=1 Tax=Limnobacter sp. TaxID=2003368 RepID=UPI002FE2D358
MEPMSLSFRQGVTEKLYGLVSDLLAASGEAYPQLPASIQQRLATLVQGMNCYYSNLIEGHRTLPIDIEKALQAAQNKTKPESGYSQEELRTLAKAHIGTTEWAKTANLHQMGINNFILEAHHIFCTGLPEDMLTIEGTSKAMIPGQYRDIEVRVGEHIPPAAQQVPRFMERFEQVYSPFLQKEMQGQNRVAAIAHGFIAHHRLAWIHPFPDGNGRISRIFLDKWLSECALPGFSVWSMSRGFARNKGDTYKAKLHNADQPRMGDLDGRGNLTEKGLIDFVEYCATQGIDQANFMAGLFRLGTMIDNARLAFALKYKDLKAEHFKIYERLLIDGQLDRGAAADVINKSPATTRKYFKPLFEHKLISSPSEKGTLYPECPSGILMYLFPELYPPSEFV